MRNIRSAAIHLAVEMVAEYKRMVYVVACRDGTIRATCNGDVKGVTSCHVAIRDDGMPTIIRNNWRING